MGNKTETIYVRISPELKTQVELQLQDGELTLPGLVRLLLKSWVEQQAQQ